MKVNQLIFAIQKLPGDLDVYVSDWSEQYNLPGLLRHEDIQVKTFKTWVDENSHSDERRTITAVLIK